MRRAILDEGKRLDGRNRNPSYLVGVSVLRVLIVGHILTVVKLD